MNEKELLLKVLLNATKTLLNTKEDGLDNLYVDHDTPHYNIKIEINQR
jgi:hypothetical protein